MYYKCQYVYYSINDNMCNMLWKFPRKGMIPGTKWYIKKYSDEAASKKIYNAILTDTVNKLNKNLKSIANKYINMGIKYNEKIIIVITEKVL